MYYLLSCFIGSNFPIMQIYNINWSHVAHREPDFGLNQDLNANTDNGLACVVCVEESKIQKIL